MTGPSTRHAVALLPAAMVAWAVIVGFLSLYAVLSGAAPSIPFAGSGTIGPFSGHDGAIVLSALDFFIPLVAGVAFLTGLAIANRLRLSRLALTSLARAAGMGIGLGLSVFILFYIPALYELVHPTLAQATVPLLEGLADHLAFGVAMVLVIYRLGGAVKTGENPSEEVMGASATAPAPRAH